jgi:hypothetical protein
MVFDFFVKTSITSNAAQGDHELGVGLRAGVAGQHRHRHVERRRGLDGGWHHDPRHLANGTTTGGLLGTWFRFTALSTTQWLVTGIDQGSGTVATPFATS